MNIIEFDKKNVVICGDIHGEFEALVYNLKINDITDSLIVVVGDCSFGFHKASYYDMLYKRLVPKLRTQGNTIFFVRGNHDDSAYFGGKTFVKKYMRCVADYTVISVAGHNILCVGGAISIDREPRLREMEFGRILKKDKQPLYWKYETPIFPPNELINNRYPLDRWYYGHFHYFFLEYIDNVSYCMINVLNFKTIKYC